MKIAEKLILAAALLAVSCGEAKHEAESTRKVKCEEAVQSTSEFQISTFPGKVVAASDVNLGFRVAGIIDRICAKDGQYVNKGEVIAQLDSRDYALQLSATQAEYDAIKAEVDRVVELYKEESVSANNYDKAVNGLRAITAKLTAHKNALADTKLRAPMSGYVQKSNFDKGEAVAAGTPVVSMISDSQPEIIIDIPAAYYLKQDNFEGATASFDLIKDTTFTLTLKGISPKANLNQLYRATFMVDCEGDVVPSIGMSAVVEMNYQTASDKDVVVPFTAIIEKDGKTSLWIFNDGKVNNRKVELSEIKGDGKAYVKNGLQAGEMVVTAGINSLKEGQEVEMLPKKSESNIGGIK